MNHSFGISSSSVLLSIRASTDILFGSDPLITDIGIIHNIEVSEAGSFPSAQNFSCVRLKITLFPSRLEVTFNLINIYSYNSYIK